MSSAICSGGASASRAHLLAAATPRASRSAPDRAKRPTTSGACAAANPKRSFNRRKRVSRRALARDLGGASCVDCGYAGDALEFHHRDPLTKEFDVGSFWGTRAKLEAEIAKCDVLCANCHRKRHASLDAGLDSPMNRARRKQKARAVEALGGRCANCGERYEAAVFEFHHTIARTKTFGVAAEGLVRPWPQVVDELSKCELLCANCHRELHAAMRKAS